jgi:hypothetical protein
MVNNSLFQFREKIELNMNPPITIKNAVIIVEAKALGNQKLNVSRGINRNTAKKHISQNMFTSTFIFFVIYRDNNKAKFENSCLKLRLSFSVSDCILF